MSLQKSLFGVLGGAVALTALFGLAESAHAQARNNNSILYVDLYANGGRYNWDRNTQALNNPAYPYDSITHATQHALPDDTIVVKAGTYVDAGIISQKSYLTIRPATGATVVLKGGSTNNYTLVRIDGGNHILFTGFEVDGTGAGASAGGISISPNGTNYSHDISITYCKVHDCGGGGIGSGPDSNYQNGGDHITISNNEIYHCLTLGANRASAIGLLKQHNYDNAGGFHNTIQNNKIHDNVNQNPDHSAANDLHSDGNGIIIDTCDDAGMFNGPKTLIQNNLVYGNGGRGIHVFLSSNVTVLNNTVYKNDIDPYLQHGGGELTAVSCNNAYYSNNLVQGNGIAPAFYVGAVSGYPNGTNIHFKNNTYGGAGTSAGTAMDWPSTIYFDPATVIVFLNVSINDFRLRSLSPNVALNKGSNVSGDFSLNAIDGTSRPQGGAVDRGAYEQ